MGFLPSGPPDMTNASAATSLRQVLTLVTRASQIAGTVGHSGTMGTDPKGSSCPTSPGDGTQMVIGRVSEATRSDLSVVR